MSNRRATEESRLIKRCNLTTRMKFLSLSFPFCLTFIAMKDTTPQFIAFLALRNPGSEGFSADQLGRRVVAPRGDPMLVKAFQQRDRGVFSTLLIFAMVFLILSGTQTYAQVVGATLSGTVSDASGAAVPNAQVSIKNTATGVSREISADSVGFYTAPNLLPGSYDVTFSAFGFTTEASTGVTLTVGAQQVLNATLRVGQVSQEVTVTG